MQIQQSVIDIHACRRNSNGFIDEVSKVQGMIQPEEAQSSIISPAEKNLLIHLLQSKSPNSSIKTTTILCEYQIPASWISWGRDPFIEFWREHQPVWCVTHVLLNSSSSLSVLKSTRRSFLPLGRFSTSYLLQGEFFDPSVILEASWALTDWGMRLPLVKTRSAQVAFVGVNIQRR